MSDRMWQMLKKTNLFFFFFFVIFFSSFLPFGSILPFLDVYQHLGSLVLARCLIHVIPSESSDHPLKNVADLRLEVVLVIM